MALLDGGMRIAEAAISRHSTLVKSIWIAAAILGELGV